MNKPTAIEPITRRWISPKEATWLKRGCRLAVVLAVIFAANDAWQRFQTWDKISTGWKETERIYNCMAKLSDDVLMQNQTAFSTMDAQPLGCSYRQAWVRMDEIKQVRAGKMSFAPDFGPFNLQSTLTEAVAAAVLSLSALAIIFAAYKVARWIW